MRRMWCLVALVTLVLVPAGAAAQQSAGAISGVVRDTSGGVMPGVAVEASSPALIEKVREAFTDGSGRYMIVSLPPGTYTVKFTLAGFATVERQGITLTTGFTATVDADLKVGTVEETVIVSVSAPIVDTQNVQKQAIINRETMDSIPAPRVWSGFAALLPGVTMTANNTGATYDVGGGGGLDGQRLMYQGSDRNDMTLLLNGMPIAGEANSIGGAPSDLFFEETAVILGAQSAEFEVGGVGTNFIPKSGGNRFSGQSLASFTNSRMQAKNVTAEQFAQGVPYQNGINELYEVAVAGGGPIVTDRLWFYGSGRRLGTNRQSPVFYDTKVDDWQYIPDLSRPAVEDTRPSWDVNAKITWKVGERDRVSGNVTWASVLRCCNTLGPKQVLEGSDRTHQTSEPVLQGNWTRTVTDRLLLEAGGQYSIQGYYVEPQPTAVFPAVTERQTGITFRSKAGRGNRTWQDLRYYSHYARFSLSYVTGSHAFKAGVQLWPGHETQHFIGSGPYAVTLLNGVPTTVTFFSDPRDSSDYFFKLGAFAQDQWTLRRVTLNLGVRLDTHDSWYPDQHLVATSFGPQTTASLPARDYPGLHTHRWRDISPRVGVAWDVFGDGKTAVKASASRYVANAQATFARNLTPANLTGAGLARAWTDFNGDYIPQGDPLSPVANGELTGANPNLLFGTPVLTTRTDPDYALGGWGARGYNWSYAASVSRQLMPNVGLDGGYFFRTFGNQITTDNLLVASTDYDPYCVTAPVDARLPGGGGQQICGLYNLNPSKVGLVDNVQTFAKNYGKYVEHYKGMDLSVNVRVGGVRLRGGVAVLKSLTDMCDVVSKVDNPSTRFCRSESPYQRSWKFYGSYMLPWKLMVAGTFQATPGAGVAASWVAVNSEIKPSLGRNLSAGATSATVELIEPNTIFRGGVQKVDMRLSRSFKLGRVRSNVSFDVYNVTNNNVSPSFNGTYGTTAGGGATWLDATSVLSPRLVKIVWQTEF
jgi:hypothetical protein